MTSASGRTPQRQALTFVPITITDGVGTGPAAARSPGIPAALGDACGRIELEIDGSRMVITGNVDPAVVATLVAALREPR